MMNFETESKRRFVTAVLLIGAVLCAGFWTRAALRVDKTTGAAALPAQSPVPVPVTVVAGTTTEMARVLGVPRPGLALAAMRPADRFRAVGVIASASGQGAALIAVDKQPPKPFVVGTTVAPGFVLKAVTQREVRLADSVQGAVTATLPLPDPSKVKSDAGSNNPALLNGLPAVEKTAINAAETDASPPSQPSIRSAPNPP
jgi:general secretion pathway protein C